jgi:outer membrane lipopolysaccharide assembly protein LptE/RlpB
MHRTLSSSFVIALAVVLGACGKQDRDEEPMPVEETVFADQVEALDRAKQQAKEMEGRMQDLNSQLDAAEGTPREPQADEGTD